MWSHIRTAFASRGAELDARLGRRRADDLADELGDARDVLGIEAGGDEGAELLPRSPNRVAALGRDGAGDRLTEESERCAGPHRVGPRDPNRHVGAAEALEEDLAEAALSDTRDAFDDDRSRRGTANTSFERGVERRDLGVATDERRPAAEQRSRAAEVSLADEHRATGGGGPELEAVTEQRGDRVVDHDARRLRDRAGEPTETALRRANAGDDRDPPSGSAAQSARAARAARSAYP